MGELDELARRGDEARKRHDEELAAAGPPPETKEQRITRERERSFIFQSRPLLQLARIAGWSSLFTLPLGVFLVVIFHGPGKPPSTGDWIFVYTVAVLGVVSFPWLFLVPGLVRRALDHERGRFRAFAVEGWMEAMGDDWSFSGTMVDWEWGKLLMVVTLQASMDPSLVERALAAIDPESTVSSEGKTLHLESPQFGLGSQGYRWGRAVLDKLLPAVHAEHPVARVKVRHIKQVSAS